MIGQEEHASAGMLELKDCISIGQYSLKFFSCHASNSLAKNILQGSLENFSLSFHTKWRSK
jgi:hypothetical protein